MDIYSKAKPDTWGHLEGVCFPSPRANLVGVPPSISPLHAYPPPPPLPPTYKINRLSLLLLLLLKLYILQSLARFPFQLPLASDPAPAHLPHLPSYSPVGSFLKFRVDVKRQIYLVDILSLNLTPLFLGLMNVFLVVSSQLRTMLVFRFILCLLQKWRYTGSMYKYTKTRVIL